MKGLFNYATAYRKYIQPLLQDFMVENIQYAEIRVKFMKTNELWTDDGTSRIDNIGIMDIIIEEYNKFQSANDGYFGGLKIIYCTPRSSSNKEVEFSLDECRSFKKRWPDWIAGISRTTFLCRIRPNVAQDSTSSVRSQKEVR